MRFFLFFAINNPMISMKYLLAALSLSLLPSLNVFAQKNPVINGWYADPEGIKYGDNYWIFSSYSVENDKKVFFD